MKRIIVPGWAVIPELYAPLMPATSTSAICDFQFFKGDSAENLVGSGAMLRSCCDVPCVIHAHSLGAMLALGAIGNIPSAKALVVYSGFAKFARSGADNPHGQPPDVLDMMKKHVVENPERLVRNFYRSMFYPAKYGGDFPASYNIQCLACGLGLLASCDFRSNIASVRVPVLMLHGKKDKVVDFGIAEELASILPDARLHLFEDAGHALPFTHTDECRAVTEDFIHGIK